MFCLVLVLNKAKNGFRVSTKSNPCNFHQKNRLKKVGKGRTGYATELVDKTKKNQINLEKYKSGKWSPLEKRTVR
jgi:hypothetical protein